MSHIDPERLALYALGEPGITADEAAHLEECPGCVDEVAALRRAVAAGRASVDVGELETPPEGVWERIRSDLSLPEPAPSVPAGGEATPGARRSRWRVWVLAASVVLVVGAGVGGWAYAQRAQPATIAQATLDALPEHAGARGTAVVEESADGSRRLRIDVSADAVPGSYREVWLLSEDASSLVSLGVLGAAEQTFAIPAGVDLGQYPLVDVSVEPIDGDPGHSGDSIVRGALSS